jgi:polysaccharide biosynthesis/export protein
MSRGSMLSWGLSWGKRVLLFGIAVMLGLAGAAVAQNTDGRSNAVSAEGEVRNSETVTGSSGTVNARPGYVIGAGDVLSVNVLNEPEVTGKVPVRPDGMITVPLIGDVQASGLTTDKLEATITKKLSDYVKQPAVTVVVEEMNSREFNVLGKVQHPGAFALNKPTRVLDALALAGGFNEFAKKNKVYILRTDASGQTTRLPFNYKKVAAGEDDSENVQLQAGDTVIVP